MSSMKDLKNAVIGAELTWSHDGENYIVHRPGGKVAVIKLIPQVVAYCEAYCDGVEDSNR